MDKFEFYGGVGEMNVSKSTIVNRFFDPRVSMIRFDF